MEFFHTHISPKSIELVNQVLQSGWVSEGRMVKAFEAQLATQLGMKNPVAVNSGTSALHLGLAVAKVGLGDEVILSPQTFIATGLVILMQGATPVFADIQPFTGNIDPESIRAKITPRTRAVVPVHWGGYPCDLNEINAIAAEHRLAVIEDAAQALGATYKGKPIGTISHFTAFSFQAIKHLTTGDGGTLCCAEYRDYLEARRRRWFGIDRANTNTSILGVRDYEGVTELGYKYHLNDLGAAVGLGNLTDFQSCLYRRQEIGALYRQELANIPGLKLLECRNDRTHAYWIFTALVERREDFIRKMREKGIPTSVVDLRIDRNPIFGGIREDLVNQTWFNERQVAIPLHAELTESQIRKVISAIKSGW
jgi:perosamine synthetase